MSDLARINAAILRGRSQHLQALRAAEKDLIKLYQKAADDVGKLILTYGDDANRVEAYLALKAQLEERIDELNRQLQQSMSAHLNAEAARGIRDTSGALQVDSLRGVVTALSGSEFGHIYHEAVIAMRTTVDGIELSAKIWQLNLTSLNHMRELMLQGMLSGRSASEIYRQMKSYLKLSGVDLRTKFWRQYFRENPPGRGVYRSAWKNTLRVLRTESNRAFRVGATLYAKGKAFAAGMRWNLSAAHPEQDICDELATQDLYGLGSGVYPVGATPDSGHPHCICYVTVEFTPDVKEVLSGAV